MFPNPSTRADSSRRRWLATVGAAAAVAVSGCTAILSSDDSGGEGDTREIVVGNDSGTPALVAVRLTDRAGDLLFSRVYEIDPQHTDESAGVDARPARVTVFTQRGASASWEYAPDLDPPCDGADVGVTVTDDGIESWYGC